MRLFTPLLTCGLAAAAALAGLASTASAQTVCATDITAATPLGPVAGCDRIWGDEADEAYVVLDTILFVLDTDLTIVDGTIVRGQPRSESYDPLNPLVGAPGTLIVARDAFLNARGNPGSPIIFTTAATDNDNNGIADDVVAPIGEFDRWNPGDLFLDDTPATNPLSTLMQDGNQAGLLHGGLVLIGRAPTNLDDSTTGIEGEGICEGLPVPGVAPAAATYGGNEPHDSSGVLEYVSVRHAGDEISPGNELNGITFCGVGDGTIVSHVESYANGDDGFEMFGGTVNLRNVVVAYAGDDSLDVDQGYVGTIQHAFTLSLFHDENDGGLIGTGGSGDRAGEFDGEDCPTCIVAADGFVIPDPNMVVSNWTHVGNQAAALNAGVTNPAVDAAAANLGIQADTQWGGVIANTLVLGQGATQSIQHNSSGRNLRAIVATTTDSAIDAGATAAANTGDAQVAAGSEYIGGSANVIGFGGQLLANENHFFRPTGVLANGRGKLLGAKTSDAGVIGGAPMNPRPLNPANAEVSGGIEPHWPGMDRSATYRGAFGASGDLWAEPWSALALGGIVD